MLGVGQGLGAGRVGQFDKTVVSAPIGQVSGIHLLGQPEPTVEADVHAEGIPGLQAHVTAAQHRMFIVVVEVKTFALFQCGRKPAPFRAAAYGDGQARFQGAQDGNEAGAHPITSSDVFDEVLLAGLAGTQEMVRPSSGGGGLLGRLAHPFGEGLRVGGEVDQAYFGGAQVGAHTLKQRTEAGVEAESIPTTQGAVDQGTKLVHKGFGNEVFGQKWFLHKHSSTKRRPRFQLPPVTGGTNVIVTWQSVAGVNYFLERGPSPSTFTSLATNLPGQPDTTSLQRHQCHGSGPVVLSRGSEQPVNACASGNLI